MGVIVTVTLPDIGGDISDWGAKLNADLTAIVGALAALSKTDVGLPLVPNTDATQRSSHQGSQAHGTISDWTEAVQDTVGAQLVADSASDISVVYDDTAGSITVGQGGTKSPVRIYYDSVTGWPARSSATVDPTRPVDWVGVASAPPPAGGAAGAIANDLFIYGAG